MTNLSGANLNNGAAVGPQGEGRESPSNFPAYPVYKDSGVDWLGEIPEGWSIKPLWALFRRHKLTGFPDEQLLSVYRDYGVIPKASRDDNFNKPSDDLGAYQLVQVGDLAINKMKAWQGSVGISSHKGIVSPAYHVYAPSHSEAPQYLHHLFRCNEYIAGYLANSKGIRVNQWDLEPQQHSRMSVLLPSFQEQIQIARFLDHETARIDALIEEQQRLIELLKEKRRGIVLSALSDTSLPLVRIGHAVDVISRPVKQREDESYTPIGLFNRDRGLFHKEPREMQDMGDSDFFWIKSGDLIISGQFAWEGAVAMAGESEEGLVVSHRYPVLRGKHCVANTEYLYAILTTKHGDFLLNESSRGAAGRNRPLNLAALLKEKIRIPSKEIQEQVRNLVQNEAKVLTECRQQISLLQERRSALISAAVTGKIDVRGWQPPAHTQAPKSADAEAH